MSTATLPTHLLNLPTPDQRPGAAVVVFDGECAICKAQIDRICRWDTRARLAFLSLHDPLVAQRYPDLSRDELMARMYVVDPAGGRHGGADAFRYISGLIPRMWPLWPLLHLPGSRRLWQWCYRQVAARRYRLGRAPCADDRCGLHAHGE
jgi:predicted DCC family thiol-disulfide oxidoreductase YuxK